MYSISTPDEGDTPDVLISNATIKDLDYGFEVSGDFECLEIGVGNSVSGRATFRLHSLPAMSSPLDLKELLLKALADTIKQAATES